MKPVVFQANSRASVGLAHCVVVSQPTSGSPTRLSRPLTAP